jgi:hypothetical protein
VFHSLKYINPLFSIKTSRYALPSIYLFFLSQKGWHHSEPWLPLAHGFYYPMPP